MAVIRRMVRDLDFPVRIEALPTVREADGLALSSRNAYLGAGRARAGDRPLEGARRGRARGPGSIRCAAAIEAGRSELELAGIDPEYLEARDAETLEPVDEIDGRQVLVAVAAQVGGARLIDNVLIGP